MNLGIAVGRLLGSNAGTQGATIGFHGTGKPNACKSGPMNSDLIAVFFIGGSRTGGARRARYRLRLRREAQDAASTLSQDEAQAILDRINKTIAVDMEPDGGFSGDEVANLIRRNPSKYKN
jgi:hypothetical protein